MKCHWSHADDGHRFWLPGCMGGAVYGPHMCTCPRKMQSAEKQREKDLLKTIRDQEKEIAALNRIIEMMNKRNRTS
jgi:hypothetical protein